MRWSRMMLILAASVCLSACATYSWRHPHKGKNEFNQDKYACIQQSAHAFPALIRRETQGSGYTTPGRTTCTNNGGQSSCTTTPAIYHPPAVRNVDVNEANREKAFDACMQTGGWMLVEDPVR